MSLLVLELLLVYSYVSHFCKVGHELFVNLQVCYQKFISIAILFAVKYGFCITIHVIFLSPWVSIALGQTDHSLSANDPITMYTGKCDSLYHMPDYTEE